MRVLCAGLATRDTIIAVPDLPERDGRVVAIASASSGGGPAATAAVTLGRLGVDVAFAGTVGDDEAGAFVVAGLEAEGVDVSRVAVVQGARTPQSTILVASDGSRSIVHIPGDAPFPRIGDVEAEWVHVDHVGYGKVSGRLSVDGGNPIAGLELDGVALYAPTETRLRDDFGDASAAIRSGAELVVVTRGDRGSAAWDASGRHVDAAGVPCEPCVSTLGAGDVFHGALLAYLLEGAPLDHALRAANTAASLSCRALDGRSAIPTRTELEAALA
jgi:sugar/nucleoside kinase (ribokinase family)